ncbi:MAG: tellurium resistance protein TerC [Pseudomonadota bacterium]
MLDIFTLENLFTLMMLILLQAVLGFDNLLYISIESKRVAPESQKSVRRWGILMAVALRIVLLFVVIQAIALFQNRLFEVNWPGVLEGDVNGHAIIVLFGGGFIIYTAMKEILHMMAVHDIEKSEGESRRSVVSAVSLIVMMNLIFSFDSILSAIALTDVFAVMAAAIIISGVLMLVLADRVSEFLAANRMYEVLGLFILFIVGIMLVSEGGHLAQLKFFGYPVEPMAKSTFYFVLVVLIFVDIVQARYRAKLMAAKAAEIDDANVTTAKIDAKLKMIQQ